MITLMFLFDFAIALLVLGAVGSYMFGGYDD